MNHIEMKYKYFFSLSFSAALLIIFEKKIMWFIIKIWCVLFYSALSLLVNLQECFISPLSWCYIISF